MPPAHCLAASGLKTPAPRTRVWCHLDDSAPPRPNNGHNSILPPPAHVTTSIVSGERPPALCTPASCTSLQHRLEMVTASHNPRWHSCVPTTTPPVSKLMFVPPAAFRTLMYDGGRPLKGGVRASTMHIRWPKERWTIGRDRALLAILFPTFRLCASGHLNCRSMYKKETCIGQIQTTSKLMKQRCFVHHDHQTILQCCNASPVSP